MYEYLEKLFGKDEQGNPVALTFEQLTEKLNNSKDIKLANLSEGNYVSKDKYEAAEIKINGLNDQLTDANNTIQSYKDMDIEGIKKSAKDWEDKYITDTQALNDKLAAQERSHNADMFFNEYRFSSKAAQNGIRAEFDKLNLPFKDGAFVGGKEFMDKLKGDDDYKAAFAEDVTPSANPDPDPAPADPKPHFSQSAPNPLKPKQKVTLTELMRQKNENPNAEIKYD